MFQLRLNTLRGLILKRRALETPALIYTDNQVCLISPGHAVDYGTDFVTAFPENLAYYFPAQLMLRMKITTFLPNTMVTVNMNGTIIYNQTISAVGVIPVDVQNAEIDMLGVSGNSIRITSDKNITVLSYNRRGDSIQANVVPPTTRLGKHYIVPCFNYSELAVNLNSYNFSGSTNPTVGSMDFSMGLLIVNAEAVTNTITVKSAQSSDDYVLGPYALILLPSSSFCYEVTSTAKAAVIITNPCMDSLNCRCNLVAHQLRPTDFLGTSFIFPLYDSTAKRLFVTSSDSVDLISASQTQSVAPGSTGLLPFLPGQNTGGLTTTKPASVRVILPGLIIDLLPTTMFAGCFLVQSNDLTKAKVLLIVKTTEKGDVHMDSSAINVGSAGWIDLSDVGYSWAVIPPTSMSQTSCIIWHPTSPIAVYVLETSGSGVTYGGPAISINDEPGKVLQHIETVTISGV